MDRHESVTASQTSSSTSVDKFVNRNQGRIVREVAAGVGLLSIGLGAGACVTQVEPTKTVPPETGAVDPAAVTKPPEEVHETQTAVAEETDTAPTTTPKPSKTPEPTATKEPTVEPTSEPVYDKENEWIAQGFLPDYTKNGGELSYKTESVNGANVELVGFRIGQTEIWVDKNMVNLEAMFGLDGSIKYAGETLLPDPTKPDAASHIAKIGALIHASNLGLVEKYGDKWYEEYIKYLGDHPDATYVLQGEAPLPGDPETYAMQGIGEVDATKPVRLILLEPKMDKSEAMDRPDRIMGGDARAPFGLEYANRSQGYYGVHIENGELKVLTSEFLVDEKLMGVKSSGSDSINSSIFMATVPSYRGRLVSFQNTPKKLNDAMYKELWAKPKLEEPYIVWSK